MRAVVVPVWSSALLLLVGTSGTVAYLNLHDRSLYERVMDAPDRALRNIVERWRHGESIALAPAQTDGA